MTSRSATTAFNAAVLLFALRLQTESSFAFTTHTHYYSRMNHVLPSSTVGVGAASTTAHYANLSPLDEELQSWASLSGFGSIDKSIPAGSSGWASFRKVTVTNPPNNADNKPASFFVKSSSRSCKEMFEGEALGLMAMHACSNYDDGISTTTSTDSLRIPKVYHYGNYSSGGKGSLLVMEYLNLAGRSDDRTLGRAVARMHLAPANEESGNPHKAFGFSVDNTM